MNGEIALVIGTYSVLAITGLVGNVWVMLTVLSQLISAPRSLRRRRGSPCSTVQPSACLYLLLLSIVDLISIVPVPLLAVDIIMSRWPFGLAVCKLLFTCEGANKSLSPLVLTALSVDRYVAVCRSNQNRLREWRFALLIIAICIAISSLFILPVTFRATVTTLPDWGGSMHWKCSVIMNKSYDVLHTLVCYVLPLSLICYVYVAILYKLFKHTRSVGQRTSISLSRVVKCSVMVVAFYFICWTPYWTMRINTLLSADVQHYSPEETSSSNLSTGALSTGLEAADLEDTRGPELNFTAVLNSMSISQLDSLHEKLTSGSTTPVVGTTTVSTPASIESVSSTGKDTPSYSYMFQLYLLHALPYCQCALNWLFYAFLNRNLRQAVSAKGPASVRLDLNHDALSFNDVVYSFQNASSSGNHHPTGGSEFGSLWKSIQRLGQYVRSASDLVDHHFTGRMNSPPKCKQRGAGHNARSSMTYMTSAERVQTTNELQSVTPNGTRKGTASSSNGFLSPPFAVNGQNFIYPPGNGLSRVGGKVVDHSVEDRALCKIVIVDDDAGRETGHSSRTASLEALDEDTEWL